MAFENYKPKLGILRSQWVGLENFKDFFNRYLRGVSFGIRLCWVCCSWSLSFRSRSFLRCFWMNWRIPFSKRCTDDYLYAVFYFHGRSGRYHCRLYQKYRCPVADRYLFSGKQVNLLSDPACWRPLYIVSDLWQGLGFGSIIYVAALSGVDQELYEAAKLTEQTAGNRHCM